MKWMVGLRDIPSRFKSYGWEVFSDIDGHDSGAVSEAIKSAKTILNNHLSFAVKH